MSGSASLSVAVLFENADVVVKGVLLLLLSGSVWSWAVIIDKIIRLRMARRSARAWASRAADARTAGQLIDERVSAEANQPAGAVIAAGVEECIAFDNEPESIAERRDRIDRAMRVALGAQLRQLELRLPFLATLGSAAARGSAARGSGPQDAAPASGTPITFSPRGLPCTPVAYACSGAGLAPAAYWAFFQDTQSTDWEAVTVSPAGRIQKWIYARGVWSKMY